MENQRASCRAAAHIALHLLVAATGFFAVAATLATRAPWPTDHGVRAKFEHFRAHKDAFDAVFFGSSFTHRAVDPTAMDAAFAARGTPQVSFNFGIAGMSAFEMDHLLARVLALQPARLQRVFVETASWAPPEEGWMTGDFMLRAIYWHTLPRTLDVLHAIRIAKRSRADKARLAALHVRLLAQRSINHGSATETLQRWFQVDAPPPPIGADELAAQRGYQDPAEQARGDPDMAQRRAHFLAHLEAFRAQVDLIDEQNQAAFDLATFPLRALTAQRDRLLATGADVIYFIPPVDAATPAFYRLQELGVFPALLAFNQPRLYGSLYQRARRHDRGHLSRSGARNFARLVAMAYLEP